MNKNVDQIQNSVLLKKQNFSDISKTIIVSPSKKNLDKKLFSDPSTALLFSINEFANADKERNGLKAFKSENGRSVRVDDLEHRQAKKQEMFGEQSFITSQLIEKDS